MAGIGCTRYQYCDGDIAPTTNRIVLVTMGMMATKITNGR